MNRGSNRLFLAFILFLAMETAAGALVTVPAEFTRFGIKDEKRAIDFVKWSLVQLETEPAFAWIVLVDFETKPTYAKAKAIADIFLTDGTQTEVNTNKNDLCLPKGKMLAAALDRFKNLVAKLVKAKAEPDLVNVIEWWLSLPEHGAPSSMFGAQVAAVVGGGMAERCARFAVAAKDQKALQEMFAKGTGASPEAKAFIQKVWEPARKALEKAGIDVKALALPGVK